MGETTIEISRVRAVVEEVLKDLEKDFKIEAEVIFGSWCRSGGEAWSDIDVLIVSDSILAAHFRSKRVDLFLYTFEEVERMALRGTP